ncbi:MAG: divalent-cation tolerance protein CutA [Aquificaceae bacterium]|nr:divalent-cation tolerance protein CutA [Aquificaceae bacterium]MDW8097130.1 divalent-cation tolerance protein CutA [Aquificaceae bacterium]
MMGYLVVLITIPVDRAKDMAELIIQNKLGACVNVVPEVNSIYWWKGNIERDKEALLVVKTSAGKFKELLKSVKTAHPYTVPEIIALPIVAGNEDYLRWIEDSLI